MPAAADGRCKLYGMIIRLNYQIWEGPHWKEQDKLCGTFKRHDYQELQMHVPWPFIDLE